MNWTWLTVVVAALVLTGCAAQSTPYDAPVVGENGVASIDGVDRIEYPHADNLEMNTLLVFHVTLDDGRACDFAYMKMQNKGGPDRWLALHHQRPSVLGTGSLIPHVTLPQDVCLTVGLPEKE